LVLGTKFVQPAPETIELELALETLLELEDERELLELEANELAIELEVELTELLELLELEIDDELCCGPENCTTAPKTVEIILSPVDVRSRINA